MSTYRNADTDSSLHLRSKKCKYAVLSDAPFVKHDGNVWHKVRTWSMCFPPRIAMALTARLSRNAIHALTARYALKDVVIAGHDPMAADV